MGRKNSSNESAPIFFLKLVGSVEEAPKFVQMVKEGDSYVQGDSFDTLSGEVVEFSIKTYEYTEGKKKVEGRKWVLRMVDLDEQLVVDFSMSSLSMGILNSLLSADSLSGNLEIKVYRNKEGFDNAYVTLNGERLNWKLSYDEQKKMIKEIPFGGKVMKDKTELNEYLINEAKNYLPNIIAAQEKKQAVAANDSFDNEGEGDDLPF